MILTQEQQAILDGAQGETLAKVMKTLVMYGDAFEAEKLVPITSKYNHLVTSFGLSSSKDDKDQAKSQTDHQEVMVSCRLQ